FAAAWRHGIWNPSREKPIRSPARPAIWACPSSRRRRAISTTPCVPGTRHGSIARRAPSKRRAGWWSKGCGSGATALNPVARPGNGKDRTMMATRNEARVLLVEDNKINQQFATLVLNKAGYRVELAVNGREGVDKLAASDFDIVLMDIQMPVLDGLS